MNIKTTKYFDKKFNKLSKKIKEAFKKRISIFISDQFDVRLNNHRLFGSLNNYRSINITGDYRFIYEEISYNLFLLIDIDTHSELYK